MRWWIKAVLQKGISLLPGSRRIHDYLQRSVWRSLQIDDFFLSDRLSHVNKHLAAWQADHPQQLPKHSLEIGTGWYPIVPIGLYLCGLDQITSVDQRAMLRPAQVNELMEWLLRWEQSDRLQQLLPQYQEERWAKAKSHWQNNPQTLDWLAQIGIRTWTGDARKLPYPDGQIPLIHSNNTFEHIPRSILQGIMQELKRVLSPEGVMSHYIDMADHYSYGDASIGPFHYLRFAERSWSWLENPFQAQNRMRISQYEALFTKLGLACKWSEIERGTEADLQRQVLAPPFANMKSEDIRVLYALAILKY